MLTVWISLMVAASLGVLPQHSLDSDVSSLPMNKELPDPFLRPNGGRVKSKSEWKAQRKYLLNQVLKYEYGELPPVPRNVISKEISTRKSESGNASEKEILLTMGPQNKIQTHIFLTLPAGEGPFPVIIRGDTIPGSPSWKKVDPKIVDRVVQRGYALAEFDRTEIAPDSAERTGLYAAYPKYDGGRLAVWAWGYHRVIDYLVTLPVIDRHRIIVTGHSRGGKATLLAGATDERIALTAPNNSGCGGAGCYRYQADNSEDIVAILKNFPFWFQPNFKEFIGNIDRLPIDQHTVKALIAPRALLSTEGLEDRWANPEGTQQTYLAAKEVFDFLGAGDRIGIAFRSGGHEQGERDWNALLDFADWQLSGKPPARRFDELAFPNAKRPFTWTAPTG